MLRLSADPAREPPDERTEYQPGLGREGNVGGHADEDAEQQPDHRADNDEESQSPIILPVPGARGQGRSKGSSAALPE